MLDIAPRQSLGAAQCARRWRPFDGTVEGERILSSRVPFDPRFGFARVSNGQ